MFNVGAHVCYISMICGMCQKILKLNLFADETNIFGFNRYFQFLLKGTQTGWFNRSKLSLNLNKSRTIHFGNCRFSLMGLTLKE